MGGGDLNMKKHFHPLTIENLERVWKAEEKKRLEEERIQQLQQELSEERQREELQNQAVESGLVNKKQDKLDWMYSHQQSVNTELYLLGQKIDKNVDVMKEDDKHTILSSATPTNVTSSLPKAADILAKVNEDPLFLIKKKEEDNRKELVQNPIKMKKLKELLRKTHQEVVSKSKKKKKHKKKHEKESRDEKDERKHRDSFKDRKRKYVNNSSEDISDHAEKNCKKKKNIEYEKSPHEKSYKMHEKRKTSMNQKKDSSRNKRYHKSYSNSSSEEENHVMSSKRVYQNRSKDTGRRECLSPQRRKHPSSPRRECLSPKRRNHPSSRGRMRKQSSDDDDDDLEAKRNEMLNNAKWMQKQRSKHFKLYEKKEKEDAENMKLLLKSDVKRKAPFLEKMKVASYSSKETSSVEDRIRRTINSKQRTNAALDKKFTSK